MGSIGTALGSFIGYKFIDNFRKTPKGKKLDALIIRMTNILTCQSGEAVVYPVFVSFRVQEATNEAEALQTVLRKEGVRAYVCNRGDSAIAPGESWEDSIVKAMHGCTMFVVLGTKTYGMEGTENLDTRKELSYALRFKKQLLVVKMTDEYASPYAQVQLGDMQSIFWRCGDPVPREILGAILATVQVDEGLRMAAAERSGSPAEAAATSGQASEHAPPRRRDVEEGDPRS